jgi:hypothetical protein
MSHRWCRAGRIVPTWSPAVKRDRAFHQTFRGWQEAPLLFKLGATLEQTVMKRHEVSNLKRTRHQYPMSHTPIVFIVVSGEERVSDGISQLSQRP